MFPEFGKTYFCQVVSIKSGSCQLRLIDPETSVELGDQILGLARNFRIPARPNFNGIKKYVGVCKVIEDRQTDFGWLAIEICVFSS